MPAWAAGSHGLSHAGWSPPEACHTAPSNGVVFARVVRVTVSPASRNATGRPRPACGATTAPRMYTWPSRWQAASRASRPRPARSPARYKALLTLRVLPLTTARNRMLLAEFDYTMKPHPTIPLINTKKERYDMWRQCCVG